MGLRGAGHAGHTGVPGVLPGVVAQVEHLQLRELRVDLGRDAPGQRALDAAVGGYTLAAGCGHGSPESGGSSHTAVGYCSLSHCVFACPRMRGHSFIYPRLFVVLWFCVSGPRPAWRMSVVREEDGLLTFVYLKPTSPASGLASGRQASDTAPRHLHVRLFSSPQASAPHHRPLGGGRQVLAVRPGEVRLRQAGRPPQPVPARCRRYIWRLRLHVRHQHHERQVQGSLHRQAAQARQRDSQGRDLRLAWPSTAHQSPVI